MSDYKLTTGVVRASYILPHGDVEAQGAEFDRWLNEHTAQALETANMGPRNPKRNDICAEAALVINIGMKNGLTRLAEPRSCALFI